MLYFNVYVYVVTGDHPSFDPIQDMEQLLPNHTFVEGFKEQMVKKFNFLQESSDTYWYMTDSWSTWMEDFASLSVEYPQLMIQVHLMNDDPQEYQYAYFCAGKFQNCPGEITYKPFCFEEMVAMCKDEPDPENEVVNRICPSINGIMDQLLSMGVVDENKVASWKELLYTEIKEYGELKATEG